MHDTILLQSSMTHSTNLYCVPTMSHSLYWALGVQWFKKNKTEEKLAVGPDSVCLLSGWRRWPWASEQLHSAISAIKEKITCQKETIYGRWGGLWARCSGTRRLRRSQPSDGSGRQREQCVWTRRAWRAWGAQGRPVRSRWNDVYGWSGQKPGHRRPLAKSINLDFIGCSGGSYTRALLEHDMIHLHF